MNLRKKLIALRKAKGWSQEDLAEKMEISRQAISRWENGTALPDAQNIFRISKLFNVTADYLLNDDYDGKMDIPSVEAATEETKPLVRKKKHLHWCLIPIICLVLLIACFIVETAKSANEIHNHPELIRVIENEVAPTCTEQGSYDEVIYCAQCGEEILRTCILTGMPTHQFENEKCIICGKEQRERN